MGLLWLENVTMILQNDLFCGNWNTEMIKSLMTRCSVKFGKEMIIMKINRFGAFHFKPCSLLLFLYSLLFNNDSTYIHYLVWKFGISNKRNVFEIQLFHMITLWVFSTGDPQIRNCILNLLRYRTSWVSL